MLELIEKVDEATAMNALSPDHDSRKRGRLKVVTDSGELRVFFYSAAWCCMTAIVEAKTAEP